MCREIGTQNADRGIELQPDVLFSEMERTVLPPMRWFVRRSFAKAKSGDLAAAARSFAATVQVQGLLVALQVVVVLRALYVLAQELAF